MSRSAETRSAGRWLRCVPLLWLALFAVLGCRTIGSDPWRSAQLGPKAAAQDSEYEPESGPEPEPEPGPSDFEPGDLEIFAHTEPGELPRLAVADGSKPLPLKHTDVDARVLGHVARVRVTQQFHNDRKQPIEVVYTFPLPENAAVDDMRMTIGARTIKSAVETREQAREVFEQARQAGHTAALLEQERPNIFTQSVTNVAPGETIEVEITYLQTLTQDGGTFEFVFPMVVGPRFILPGDAVADAARINPPILGRGGRTGHDVSLAISVDVGAPISRQDAPTHSIVASTTARGFEARLRDAETIPNRDFVLRWQVGGTDSVTTGATLFTGKPDARGHGHFALVIQPPALDLDQDVGRREMIFVVDRSGSMSGVPLALAKQTVRESLSRLRPVDTFDIVGFESGTKRLFGRPRPANEHNLVLAERFIDGMRAAGGTMMADAVEAALSPELSPDVHRYVMFLTDGYIGNEQQIFAGAAELVDRARESGGRARVFGIGIGSSPNRALIAGLSQAGDGAALYVGNREDPRAAVDGYFRLVDRPILDDIAVAWGGLEIEDVHPDQHLSLFASRSVVIHGRYRGTLPRKLKLTAKLPSSRKRVEIPVTIAPAHADDRILATLWARAQVSAIEAAGWDGTLEQGAIRRAITRIGLEYHLVTAYTSFVAVDRSRVVGGLPEVIRQPVEVPEDVEPRRAGSAFVELEVAMKMRPPPEIRRDVTPKVHVGAESRYIVRGGAYVNNPTVGAASSRDARLRIKPLEGSEGVDLRLIKRALRSQAIKIEACYEQHISVRARRSLRVRLHFGVGGELLAIEFRGLDVPKLDACVTSVLRGVPWAGLPRAEASVTIELQLRM